MVCPPIRSPAPAITAMFSCFRSVFVLGLFSGILTRGNEKSRKKFSLFFGFFRLKRVVWKLNRCFLQFFPGFCEKRGFYIAFFLGRGLFLVQKACSGVFGFLSF